ncbi:MAG: DUF1285 domain-containing protein [Dongiaceae bacterium]
MRIARDGTWFYRGTPINRKPLVKLFSTVLRRENDGEYWLVTPAERGRIAVEDAPFTAVEVAAAGAGRDQVLTFRTNLDEFVIVDCDHPIRVAHQRNATNQPGGEPRPYVLVRPGLEALILRAVFYHLVELGEVRRIEGVEQLGVWSQGQFFALGHLQDFDSAERTETAH